MASANARGDREGVGRGFFTALAATLVFAACATALMLSAPEQVGAPLRGTAGYGWGGRQGAATCSMPFAPSRPVPCCTARRGAAVLTGHAALLARPAPIHLPAPAALLPLPPTRCWRCSRPTRRSCPTRAPTAPSGRCAYPPRSSWSSARRPSGGGHPALPCPALAWPALAELPPAPAAAAVPRLSPCWCSCGPASAPAAADCRNVAGWPAAPRRCRAPLRRQPHHPATTPPPAGPCWTCARP
jgi:hypothetical protein